MEFDPFSLITLVYNVYKNDTITSFFSHLDSRARSFYTDKAEHLASCATEYPAQTYSKQGPSLMLYVGTP